LDSAGNPKKLAADTPNTCNLPMKSCKNDFAQKQHTDNKKCKPFATSFAKATPPLTSSSQSIASHHKCNHSVLYWVGKLTKSELRATSDGAQQSLASNKKA
jgi:hypothetical protein